MTLTLPVGKTALLIMDCQNDIVDAKGKLAAPTQNALVAAVQQGGVLEAIADLAAAARAAGAPVIYVRHAYRRDFADVPPNQPGLQFLKQVQALQEGTWGSEIHAAVAPAPEDSIVVKTRPNAFFASYLEGLLRAREITHLVLTGVSADGVVANTARHGADLGFYITAAEETCCSVTPEQHQAALAGLRSIATVCPAKEVKAAFAQRPM